MSIGFSARRGSAVSISASVRQLGCAGDIGISRTKFATAVRERNVRYGNKNPSRTAAGKRLRTAINVAGNANALNALTMNGPIPGILQSAMRLGIFGERNAAVFVTTRRSIFPGERVATPKPIAPPQSCTQSENFSRPRNSVSASMCAMRSASRKNFCGLSESPMPR